jgi:hypothetical protein
MSPGQFSPSKALELLKKAVNEGTLIVASKAEAGRRELGIARQEMTECLLDLSETDCDPPYGIPSKNPRYKGGAHYELYYSRFPEKNIYIKFRIEKGGPIELTSFDPDGSIR